jgi:hypothetical protein
MKLVASRDISGLLSSEVVITHLKWVVAWTGDAHQGTRDCTSLNDKAIDPSHRTREHPTQEGQPVCPRWRNHGE